MQGSELIYAVRLPVLCKYFGQLCVALAALTLPPFFSAIYFSEFASVLKYLLVLVVLSLGGVYLARRPAPEGLQHNEGMVLVAVMFVVTPLVMAWPMMDAQLSFIDALFETVSAVTTTGLSTRRSLADAPASFLFTRAWMQWYGGLGIVALSLALVMHPGVAAKSLLVGEMDSDDLLGSTHRRSRIVLKVYCVLTLVGIFGALILGLPFFDALITTLAAVSTGGFAPSDASLAAFSWPAQAWISLLCVAGAVPLMCYYHWFWERRRLEIDRLQLTSLLLAIAFVSLLLGILFVVQGAYSSWPQALWQSVLLAISAQTTTGFSVLDCAQLDAGSKLILIQSMLVGGGLGSTAGGFKLLRLLMVFSLLRLMLVRACVPRHAVVSPHLAGRLVLNEDIQAALLLILLFIAVVVLSWLPFVIYGYEPLDALFEVVSATGTVGLSVGITAPALPSVLKGVLCLDMLLGRLEIVAWLVICYPGNWLGHRMENV